MTLDLSAAQRDALAGWLAHIAALDGAAQNTVTAYRTDVTGFLAFLVQHHGAPLGLGPLSPTHHIRHPRLDGP